MITNIKFKYLLSGLLSFALLCNMALTASAVTKDELIQQQQDKIVETNQISNWPMGPIVTADSAILMDAETGAILYAKDIHKVQYPASTTKILTALIAAERCRMDEIVTFSYDAVHDMPRGSSHIAIDPGEELTMEQSLQAILIASANEVSFAVAEHISGSDWEDFAPIMNQRAEELGCLNSNFVNPNGLPDDNHYTTAYDLAMIGKAFFANELLCKYASSTLLHIPPTDKQKDDIYAATTNELFKGRKYPYEHIVASKTGYTDAAKSCLVSCAEKDGLKLICVVLHDYAPAQFEDTISLFEYGFANFEQLNISQIETKYNIDGSNFFYNNNDIFGSSKPILSLNTEDCITIPKTAAFEEVTSSISYTHTNPGEVALITYSYHGQVIGTASVDLASTEQVTYSFDTSLPTDSAVVTDPEEENIIFINVVKVILWILGISAGLIVLIILISIIRNYHFEPATSRTRRGWRKVRRKERSRYQQMKNARRHRKKAKRPSRLRDFDF